MKSRAVRRILEFATYPSGWHFGEGDAIQLETAKVALQMNKRYEDMGCITNSFPLVHGGIMLNLYRSMEILEIEIYDKGHEITYRIWDDEQ